MEERNYFVVIVENDMGFIIDSKEFKDLEKAKTEYLRQVDEIKKRKNESRKFMTPTYVSFKASFRVIEWERYHK